MLPTVFASMGQFEREVVLQSQREGILAAKVAKRTNGRPYCQMQRKCEPVIESNGGRVKSPIGNWVLAERRFIVSCTPYLSRQETINNLVRCISNDVCATVKAIGKEGRMPKFFQILR